MNTVKQDVQKLLQQMPDDCSLEDIQYHLYVLDKVRRGIKSIEQGNTLTHEQVEQAFT